MQTATQYLAGTESAVRHLFAGIDSYLELLRIAVNPIFATSELFGLATRDAEFEAWQVENRESLEAARQAEQKFIAESFALDTLSGAVFQVADKALMLYGKGGAIPQEWNGVVKSETAKYCRGKLIRTVPLGLIIHAARNQHAHFEDRLLREPNATVFKRLATAHGYPTIEPWCDPAFDLSNPSLTSFASNVRGLIRWRTYDQYVNDMRALLEI